MSAGGAVSIGSPNNPRRALHGSWNLLSGILKGTREVLITVLFLASLAETQRLVIVCAKVK